MITYKDIVSSEPAIRFKEATREYGSAVRECKKDRAVPHEIVTKFALALQEYRDYLDSIGIHMIPKKKLQMKSCQVKSRQEYFNRNFK